MSIESRHLHALVEVWARKDEPETADLQLALHLAKAFEKRTGTPTHLRAFAWHLVTDTHRAVDWELPSDVSLASCRAAAASLSHASSLLISDIAEKVHGDGGPIMVLGALAASRSIFGRWDLIPAEGALLVSLEPDETGLQSAASYPASRGIRWAAPGRLRDVYVEHSTTTTLNGGQVLIPSPELVAGRSARRTLKPEEPEALLFCGAALAAASSRSWPEVVQLANALGNGNVPPDLAVHLGLDHRLGFGVGHMRRSYLAIRRLLHRSA
ncbi:MAG: hypothetical protein ACC645_15585 [Pirellulales bacterium]